MFDLRKIFAVSKDFLKSKIYCICLNKSWLIVSFCILGFPISKLVGNSVEADSVLCKCHKKEGDPPCAFKTTTKSTSLTLHNTKSAFSEMILNSC